MTFVGGIARYIAFVLGSPTLSAEQNVILLLARTTNVGTGVSSHLHTCISNNEAVEACVSYLAV